MDEGLGAYVMATKFKLSLLSRALSHCRNPGFKSVGDFHTKGEI